LDLGPIPDRVLLSPEVEMVSGKESKQGMIIVESGETLGHYADWLKIPTQKIRNWNDMAYDEDIHLGQKIKIHFDQVTINEFNASRFEYLRAIEEDFFDNYQVIGTSTHQIKKGENIWYLCNYLYNLPYWVIKSYNNDLNLNNLNPGDLILIPEISEIKSES
jgi:membrane-bound lytic murein transglycosylase D